MKSKPAFFINILVPDDCFDINVSPDKREIILIHETQLVNILKEKLDILYKPSRSTFSVTQDLSITNFLSSSVNHFEAVNSQLEDDTEIKRVTVDLSEMKNDSKFEDDNNSFKDIEWISQCDVSQNSIEEPSIKISTKRKYDFSFSDRDVTQSVGIHKESSESHRILNLNESFILKSSQSINADRYTDPNRDETIIRVISKEVNFRF